MAIDRLKELEKIAEKLGIGLSREVSCISCKLKIQLKEAIILTNKKEVKYLCQKCNSKLEQRELQLTKQDPSLLKLVKRLEEKEATNQPVPHNPKWEPVTPEWKPQYTTPFIQEPDRITYNVSSMNEMLRLEPNYANKTNSGTK